MAINPTPYYNECNICGYASEGSIQPKYGWKCPKCEDEKMKEPKYCVQEKRPEWFMVEYKDRHDSFKVRSNPRMGYDGNGFLFSVNSGIVVNVLMSDMQDLIDSLQVFYDQEKGDG